MPFINGDSNINKLDTLPEKFTKEFVDNEKINNRRMYSVRAIEGVYVWRLLKDRVVILMVDLLLIS